MRRPFLKNIDTFTRNTILVFIGNSAVNLLNFVYQLLVAHSLSAADFAAFSALLSIFIVSYYTLATVHTGLSKYCTEYSVLGHGHKVKILLRGVLRHILILAALTLFIFLSLSGRITDILKVSSRTGAYLLAMLLALSWVLPVFSGCIQGLELFTWLASGPVIATFLKLALAFIFIAWGFGISGALSALLISIASTIIIFYFALRRHLAAAGHNHSSGDISVNYRELFFYLVPVAVSYLCYMSLVMLDTVLVRYYFLPQDSGLYSLAQLVGKIFLFFPSAIAIVMFPRVSGLKAKNMDTRPVLRQALLYTAGLCLIAAVGYNLFPAFVLKALTGKAYPESIILGRLFSLSMSFFVLLYMLINYFLSIADLRFIKYLVLFTLCQFGAIILFHKSLVGVQLILCANAILLFLTHLALAYRKK
ncbi:MAG: hypothetical protein FJZ13_00965 [Candidatus Omnitrophica bacterium]|nr:hypothetical protein [Candidatus Omnitrophota bacterium]